MLPPNFYNFRQIRAQFLGFIWSDFRFLFVKFFGQIEDKEPVIRLVKKQLKNTRNATRKKAERFLARHVD